MEDRIEADLRLSRHRELVAELEGLVKEHPLRERLWAQLLLALYRSGRQADALLAYRRARSILVEELGIDPGTDLRRLHAAILTQDSGLDLRRPVETATATELPQALEPVGPPLVGRSAELAWLRAAWTSATRDEGGGDLSRWWAGHWEDSPGRRTCRDGSRARRVGAVWTVCTDGA
jgi:hypothetical protein